MKNTFLFLSVLVAVLNCSQSQSTGERKTQSAPQAAQIGGPCEGCEAALEYGDRKLTWIDTMPDFYGAGPRIEVYGTIYDHDGVTPAKNIILYVYHTDQTGVYPTYGNEKDWGRRHGYLRTWLKTNAQGQYKFFTLRPASYPGTKNPAHIHATIKEPGKQPYWIDEYLFDDDPYLQEGERKGQQKRGGNGILLATEPGDIARYHRDIVLGMNVPGYF